MSALPSISVVVPNFNGGKTLARCLDSLLDQHYPALEVIVVDGGSTDNSCQIIKDYAPRLAWWVSEKDRGQADAINKGLLHATGSFVNWLCSDDILLPGSLHALGAAMLAHPEADVIVGSCRIEFALDPDRDYTQNAQPDLLPILPAYNSIPQQSCFWREAFITRTPVLHPDFHYAMDQELWCHLQSLGAKWWFIPEELAVFHMTGDNKSSTGGPKVARELEQVYRHYTHDWIPLSTLYRLFRYPFERFFRRDRGLLRLIPLRIIQAAYMAALAPFYGYKKVRYMSWPE